jgi:translation initiation factor IF-3
MKKARKEMSKGNKIRLVIKFKGRERESMIPLAEGIVEQMYEHLEDIALWEQKPQMRGERMLAYLTPKERAQ